MSGTGSELIPLVTRMRNSRESSDFIYFTSLANVPVDSNNRNFVETLDISALRIQFLLHQTYYKYKR